jgi:hypothetical protein
VSSWSCRYESDGICRKVDGALCRPGMKGCVLVGKVKFEDGVVPAPVWPDGRRAPADRAAREGGEPDEGR